MFAPICLFHLLVLDYMIPAAQNFYLVYRNKIEVCIRFTEKSSDTAWTSF